MMIDVVRRELVHLWYYFDVQLRQIFWYWVLGMAIGSAISVFAKDRIAAVYVWHTPYRGLILQAGHAARLAGRLYDGLHKHLDK